MTTLAVQWTEIADAAGGIAAVVGVVGGAVIAVMYGRNASAQVSAEVHVKDGEFILAARPSISAAGVFRLKFATYPGGKCPAGTSDLIINGPSLASDVSPLGTGCGPITADSVNASNETSLVGDET